MSIPPRPATRHRIQNRRGIVTAARALAFGAAFALCGLAQGQTAHEHGAGAVVKVLSSIEVREELSGKPATATTFEVTFGPGVASPAHRHPGPIFGYVIEGELDFQAGDEPVRRLKAGDTFYEPAMALHAVSRNPSDKTTTRVLAVMVHPRDAKLMVIPEPAKEGK